MPFISVSDEVAKKSFTSVENKFITKYLPVLEPIAVKVYLYSLYLYQNGQTTVTVADLANSLQLTEDAVKEYFRYLEELELVSITSAIPFEVKILDAENVYGTPKKFKPEKYSDFTKAVQSIISGRMIDLDEYQYYFMVMEEDRFEPNALLMIISYCVDCTKDNSIRLTYIKKTIKSFKNDGALTSKKVDERLKWYSSSTPLLLNFFKSIGVKKKLNIDDDKLYKKWTEALGFDEAAIAVAAKCFKAKTVERIDVALEELYKNRKFDVKEIEDYCNTKNSINALTLEIAKNLGVYMQNSAPYVENYTNVWCNYGYSFESLKTLSAYCFKQGKNSFEDMNSLIQKLYDEGVVADISIDGYVKEKAAEDKIIKEILSACGFTRKIIDWDRQCLSRWRSWNFSDEMLFEAAKLSAGKSNPMAYMNGVLSAWKTEGVFSPDKIAQPSAPAKPATPASRDNRAEIERHYYELRRAADERAEKALAKATADNIYGQIRKELNDLSISLAFAEIQNQSKAKEISAKIAELEIKADQRLKELGISKSEFTPHYSCSICNDTGYDKNGNPCECMDRFIKSIKL